MARRQGCEVQISRVNRNYAWTKEIVLTSAQQRSLRIRCSEHDTSSRVRRVESGRYFGPATKSPKFALSVFSPVQRLATMAALNPFPVPVPASFSLAKQAIVRRFRLVEVRFADFFAK